MSKENVVLFSRAVNTKPELYESLRNIPTLQDWVQVAEFAGFEFTADEFCSVLSEITRMEIAPEKAITGYFSIRDAIGAGELTKRLEQTFIGGVSRPHNPLWFLVDRTRGE